MTESSAGRVPAAPRAPETPRAKEALLRALCEATGDAVIAVSSDGIIDRASGPAARLFRCGHDQLIGAPLTAFLDLRDTGTRRPDSPHVCLGRRADGTTVHLETDLQWL